MQRRILFLLLSGAVAGPAAAQQPQRTDPAAPQAKAPSTEFRSAFESYRAYSEPELRDWRKSNEEVGAAGGHAGHRPGQSPGAQTSKPQPGNPAPQGHGDHK